MTDPTVAEPVATERQVVTDRSTIGFTPRARADLDALMASSGQSKTDVVCRAVSLLAYVQGELDAGRQLLVRDGDGTVEKVMLL